MLTERSCKSLTERLRKLTEGLCKDSLYKACVSIYHKACIKSLQKT